MNRKRFLTRLAAGGALAALSPTELFSGVPPGAGGLVIGHVSPGVQLGGIGAAAARGAQMGAAEAAQAATLLRREVKLLEATATGVPESVAAGARLLERGATVLLGGFEEETAAALSALAAEQGALFLNVGHGGDQLREVCSVTTFHVEATQAMRRDVLSQWLEAGGDPGLGPVAVTWSSRLQRYGAGQLNDRYQVRFNEMMSPASWASWMAVKVAWEAFARTRGGDAAAMAAFLAGDRARFDGHKGIELTFRPWNHQLRQPLYIGRRGADGDLEIMAEIPRPSDAANRDVADLLDTVGGPRQQQRCADPTSI